MLAQNQLKSCIFKKSSTIEQVSIYSRRQQKTTTSMARLTTATICMAFLAFCSTFTTALPVNQTNTNSTILPRANPISAADLIKIAPSTASCDGAPANAPGECRTAAQAAPYIGISFTNFGITSFNTQAALVALMLYESGSFKYAKNHFPGVPGQGTRNMQSPAFNLKYAQWLSTTCKDCGLTTQMVEEAKAKGPEAVLELVNSDEWSFGSAAWFLTTQCAPNVRPALAKGDETGWEAYMGCIGTSVTDDRMKIWKSAIALGAW